MDLEISKGRRDQKAGATRILATLFLVAAGAILVAALARTAHATYSQPMPPITDWSATPATQL